jgi:hypothetical protein
MTEREAMTDERAAMTAQAKEREYTVGWRAYRDGLAMPAGSPMAAQGYVDARYAFEEVGRLIGWSAAMINGTWAVDEPCGWKRAETDRDRAPA